MGVAGGNILEDASGEGGRIEEPVVVFDVADADRMKGVGNSVALAEPT